MYSARVRLCMLHFIIVLDTILHNREYLTSYTHDISNS